MKKVKIFNNDYNNNENENLNSKKRLFHNSLTQLNKNILLYIFKFFIIFFIFFFYIDIIIIIKKFEKKYNYIEDIYSNLISFSEKGNEINNKIIIKKIKKKIVRYKRASIDWPLPKEIKFKPWMTKKEIKAFCFFMKPGNIYFEFGSGGSTNIASYYKLKTYSVESDVKWHKKLKDNDIKANYITIDLKAQSKGFPGNETNIENWKKYIQAYKKEYNANIILIDGRFRVACGLDIFTKINNDCIVLIHDYKKRYKYHILEKFYLKIEKWDSLVALIKRPNIKSIPKNIYDKYLNEKI